MAGAARLGRAVAAASASFLRPVAGRPGASASRVSELKAAGRWIEVPFRFVAGMLAIMVCGAAAGRRRSPAGSHHLPPARKVPRHRARGSAPVPPDGHSKTWGGRRPAQPGFPNKVLGDPARVREPVPHGNWASCSTGQN